MITISEPSPRKALRLSARSSAGHGSARSNAAFTTLKPHRSSPTYRPTDHKNATHLSASAIATTQPDRASHLNCGPSTAKSP
jgi:hypothetical protein